MIRRFALIGAIALAIVGPVMAQTAAQLSSSTYVLNNIGPSDTSGLGARAYESGPGGAEALSGNLLNRSRSNMSLQRNYERMKGFENERTQVRAIDAVIDGKIGLDLGYEPKDPSADVMHRLSRTVANPPADSEKFLHERFSDSADHARSLGFQSGDMADACGYLVTSLYLAGQGQIATPLQKKLFQAACIFDFTKYLATHPAMTRAMRDDYGNKQLLVASVFEYAARHRMPGASSAARDLFKGLTSQDMSATPIDQFLCTSSPVRDSSNCANYIAHVVPRLDTVLAADHTQH